MSFVVKISFHPNHIIMVETNKKLKKYNSKVFEKQTGINATDFSINPRHGLEWRDERVKNLFLSEFIFKDKEKIFWLK